MKILLVSDSHRNNEALSNLVKKYPNMDLYLHAGDGESMEFEISPFITVKGNCDYFYQISDYRYINTEFGPLLMIHKPTDLKNNNTKYNAIILVHGHTHVPKIEFENQQIILNPGSIAYPRSSHGQTYMIINTTINKITIGLYTLEDYKLVEEKTYKK